MPDALWTADEIAEAVGGQVAGDFAVSGVSIDTRTVEPGDLFVPLVGVRDGHDFVPQAVANGAAGVLAARAVDAPAVMVADTFKALEALGVAARERAPQCKRGAVTGSVGKTSVTRAIEAGLRLAGKAHASVKSYNNHIGVPLTLARMPRDTERAVFEVGMNHAGEIVPLSGFVRPHAVAITTVGPVHIENFSDGEAGVARAKAEILAGLQPGGIAVLNADNHWFDFLKGEAEKVGATVWSFGEAAGATARLTGFQVEGAGATVSVDLRGEALTFPIHQTGVHWGPNSLCVLLMLEALDVPRETALAALAAFAPIEGRGAEKTIRIPGGAFTLVDESYNANPVSMQAALKTLGARKVAGRRVVALTDMLELGEGSAQFHAELAEPIAAANVDAVFLAGVHMKSLWEALPPTRRGGYAEVAEKLTSVLAGAVQPGDVVMVKGSNGSKAGVLAAALAALDLGEQG
ncbi:UDP-N-acetylmuramoyl-tripeptide--D-alanyl-D-alanine ligase [Caulobacter vibrioides]|uniref:UDP-N-acetylmuramoyl-tripeptide--D-alanyl-D-alanine ligase n=2 Tax=Caulobacter vibrioides TaxID=155892 RepID=Q9A596_CAUVC|nr:UDP-N-acetylmuramoyl-tripeptide--D-alanyl-D-alanine ligase [Caulobacter vibrioides]YP_002518014.1 UDP-N-acetylmuramoyl-tripeptide--D-alanyl-D- alanine ligase [Caulobacter vibrioides NA1000]QBQ57290.1 UDP-N-acetylmuramoyl-tripeptide--D-alanyl-D-alanine ligase [synthetic Caulobacter sp. 'ethensis']AAK24528.1 UDP-N-acetylmuramoylalanyl-D-glutamyl-2,6-diaminopimelate--D-alanyl-D-alanyl ligase [Caulobacter vibrioides CB15]ACL96106.1 UDP-N-acetylmuramoyl-tripeptide--D-alanyl-D- alanine ligase [Cau